MFLGQPIYKSKNPILMNTGQNNNSLYVPVATITNNPPTITYAGGRPIYQLSGGTVSYPTNANFSTINTSTINVYNTLDLDGNILTTSGSELLLNGVPIATTSNISSIGDWALYSAVSSINCATNNIVNVGNIVGKTGDMSLSNVGTITFDTLGQGAIVNLSTINGVSWSSGGGGGGGSNVSTISGIVTYDTADGGLGGDIAVANITAGNGLYGKINMTANAGVGGNSSGKVAITANGGSGASGLFGQIDIIANEGSASGVITGGKINITANTGLSGGVPSAVNINAGGITVQSGFTTPIGSVGGYTFIGGNSGVNICGGSPGVLPNVPGTTYIYGTTGVEIPSDMYVGSLFPYQYGILNGPDLLISGREYNIGLGNHIAYVNIAKAKSISFGGTTDIGNIGQINGLSTINGQPYVPGGGGGGTSIGQADGIVSVGSVGQINIFPATGQPTLINNSISITDNDITGVGAITIQDSITLEGAGTITLNGSSGSPGQVIGIPPAGTYPEWVAPVVGGIYQCLGTEVTTITIDIENMNANGIVSAIYIHPGTGGAGQWIKSITPGVNNVVIEVGLVVSSGESVIWSVISFGTAV